MATVPRISGTSVNSTALPSARMSVNLNADAYGISQSQDGIRAGQDIAAAGGKLAESALREQDQANVDAVLEAETKLTDSWLGFQEEASQRKGTNAWGLRNDTSTWFDKQVPEIAKGLNPAAQRIFSQRAQQRRVSGIEWASGWERRERDASLEQKLNASLVAAQNAAAADPTPANVQIGIKGIEKNLRATAQINGWDGEYLNQRILEEQGKLHAGVIKNLIEIDPRAARSYAEANKGQIPGTALDEINRAVTQANQQIDAQEFADAALKSGRSETQILAEIRAKYQGDDEDLFVAAVRSRFNERDAAIARADKANREAVWNALASANGDMTKVPAAAFASLDAYDQQRAKDYAKSLREGDQPETDWDRYTEFWKKTDADKAKVDPLTLRPYLSDSEYKQVVQTIDALNNPTAKPYSPAQTPSAQVNTALDAIGLAGDAFNQQRGLVMTDVMAQVEIHKAANKGAEPDYATVQKFIADAVTERSKNPAFYQPLATPSAKPTTTLNDQLGDWHNKLGLSGADKAAQRGMLDSTVKSEVDNLRARKGGVEPSYDEVDAIIKRATKETRVERNWWPDSTVSPLTVEVPDKDRGLITEEYLKSRGREPSELEIREAYIRVQAGKGSK